MKIINISLSQIEQKQLQDIVLFGVNEAVRTRCRIILLRANGISTKDIAALVGLQPQSVNRWLKAFIKDGIDGLAGTLKNAMDMIDHSKACKTCEPVMNSKSDKETRCIPPSPSTNTISDTDAAIRLICDNINSWNSQTHILTRMQPMDILSLVRNDCMQTAFLLGANPVINETVYNIKRHEAVGQDGKIPLPGAEIDSTIECGVDLQGEALVRAKVTLK